MERGIDAMLMRGGTSKGLYLRASDVPSEPGARDDLLRRLLGSPDPRQIDGVGGAHPLTSKVAIVAASTTDGVDLDYLFLQANVEDRGVSDRQTCGNLLAGVGQFGLERGLVDAGTGTMGEVRIRLLNTGTLAVASFPLTADGLPDYDGDASIAGVPGTAAAVQLDFADTAGATCGALLPTGTRQETIEGVTVTCIDNGMPVVALPASDVGLRGDESCAELEANQGLRHQIETIRLEAGRRMGLGDVTATTIPKMTLVAPAVADGDVVTRSFIPHRCHDAIGVLAAVSVATACRLPGSAVQGELGEHQSPTVVLEHPTGTFTARVELSVSDQGVQVGRSGILRTARKLMDGVVFPR